MKATKIILALVILTFNASADTGGDQILFAGGKTDYSIYVGEQTPSATAFAARELEYFLEQISGAAFSIVTTEGLNSRPQLILSREPVAENDLHEDDPGELGEDGFELRTRGDQLLITGGSPRGALYGVYFFLEEFLDTRWYSSDFSVIPQKASFSLGSVNITNTPRFTYREVFSRDADDALFSVRNRLNGQSGHRLDRELGALHGESVDIRRLRIHSLVPPATYGKSHPEYFGGGQLQFANEDVRRISIEAAKSQLKKWPGEPFYLLIVPEDLDTYYSGGQDGALIEVGGAPGAAYVDYVRAIAESIDADYPQVTVLALAYKWSRKPPVRADIPDNMAVMLSDIELDFSVPMDVGSNQDFLADLDGWTQLTDHILVWDYITNFSGYLLPHPNLRVLGPNLRLLAARPEVKGVYEQGSYNSLGGEFAELRAWVLAKLLWDPELDAQASIRSFIEGYYGAAAPKIERYISRLHAEIQRTDTKLGIDVPATAEYLSFSLLKKADDLFSQAEQAVADQPAYLYHVRTARIPVDYAILVNRGRLKAEGERKGVQWPRNDDDRLARLARNIEQAGVTAYRQGGEIAEALEALAISRQEPAADAFCQVEGKACIVKQDIGFKLSGDAKIVADERASDGAAARMASNSTVWGIRLPLDELLPATGTWSVYIRARVDSGSGEQTHLALVTGIYPGVKEEVQVGAFANEGYQNLALPRTWAGGTADRMIYVRPPDSQAITALYIDAIFAQEN